MLKSVEHSEKIQLTTQFTSESIIAKKKAAMAGLGGALISAFSARQEIQAGQLIPFEIDHPAFTSIEACLIVRQGRLLSPAANQLLRLIAAKFSLFAHNASHPNLKKIPPSPQSFSNA